MPTVNPSVTKSFSSYSGADITVHVIMPHVNKKTQTLVSPASTVDVISVAPTIRLLANLDYKILLLAR